MNSRTQNCPWNLVNVTSLLKKIQYLGHIPSTTGIKPLPSKIEAIKNHVATKDHQTSMGFPWSHTTLPKCIKDFAHIAKPLMTLMQHDVKFTLTPTQLTAFITLKEPLIQAPILHYPDPAKSYIVYTDTLDDICGDQLPKSMMTKSACCFLLAHLHGSSV